MLFFPQRNTRGSDNPADCFRFNVEERVECLQSKKVKYSNRDDFIIFFNKRCEQMPGSGS
jgi:uncharacterized UBP type Zn finger protein